MNELQGKPNIIQLLDFFYTVDEQERIIQNAVLEYCDGSLEAVIDDAKMSHKPVPMDKVKKYMKQLLTGLEAMHKVGISHRDLKPENVLLADDEIKIADLGSSKKLDLSEKRMNTPYVVSRYYRAPELILACNWYEVSIDIFSVGCMFFELLTKNALFPGESEGF